MAFMHYRSFEFSNPLTQEQIDFFEEHGFLHFKGFIQQEKVDLFKQEMKSIEERWISQGLEKINGVPIKFGVDVDGKPIVQRFAFSSQYSRVLSDFIHSQSFNALFPLLGPGAINPRVGENEKDGLVINHYINTEKSAFLRMGWHTDCFRDVFYGKKIMPMLNVGIHLTDAVEDESGLRLIPGTHKQNIFNLAFRKLYFLDHRKDKNEIGLQTQKGDLTIHDGRLWHRVAQASIVGEKSRRQVMYVPIISGEYAVKHEKSPTVFYQRFQNMTIFK